LWECAVLASGVCAEAGDHRENAAKWKQGRAKPNPQAAALVLLVRRYPDTLERLEKLAAG